MIVPFSTQKKIIEFLASLPNVHDHDTQRALIYNAGLDPQLQDQIPFGRSPTQFIPTIVDILIKYGTLHDGRSALEAVLLASKQYVGYDKALYCDMLITELHGEPPTEASRSSLKIKRVGQSPTPPKADHQALPPKAPKKRVRWSRFFAVFILIMLISITVIFFQLHIYRAAFGPFGTGDDAQWCVDQYLEPNTWYRITQHKTTGVVTITVGWYKTSEEAQEKIQKIELKYMPYGYSYAVLSSNYPPEQVSVIDYFRYKIYCQRYHCL